MAKKRSEVSSSPSESATAPCEPKSKRVRTMEKKNPEIEGKRVLVMGVAAAEKKKPEIEEKRAPTQLEESKKKLKEFERGRLKLLVESTELEFKKAKLALQLFDSVNDTDDQ